MAFASAKGRGYSSSADALGAAMGTSAILLHPPLKESEIRGWKNIPAVVQDAFISLAQFSTQVAHATQTTAVALTKKANAAELGEALSTKASNDQVTELARFVQKDLMTRLDGPCSAHVASTKSTVQLNGRMTQLEAVVSAQDSLIARLQRQVAELQEQREQDAKQVSAAVAKHVEASIREAISGLASREEMDHALRHKVDGPMLDAAVRDLRAMDEEMQGKPSKEELNKLVDERVKESFAGVASSIKGSAQAVTDGCMRSVAELRRAVQAALLSSSSPTTTAAPSIPLMPPTAAAGGSEDDKLMAMILAGHTLTPAAAPTATGASSSSSAAKDAQQWKSKLALLSASLDSKLDRSKKEVIAEARRLIEAHAAELSDQLARKAGKAEVVKSLAMKADVTDLNLMLGAKADKADLNARLKAKADTSELLAVRRSVNELGVAASLAAAASSAATNNNSNGSSVSSSETTSTSALNELRTDVSALRLRVQQLEKRKERDEEAKPEAKADAAPSVATGVDTGLLSQQLRSLESRLEEVQRAADYALGAAVKAGEEAAAAATTAAASAEAVAALKEAQRSASPSPPGTVSSATKLRTPQHPLLPYPSSSSAASSAASSSSSAQRKGTPLFLSPNTSKREGDEGVDGSTPATVMAGQLLSPSPLAASSSSSSATGAASGSKRGSADGKKSHTNGVDFFGEESEDSEGIAEASATQARLLAERLEGLDRRVSALADEVGALKGGQAAAAKADIVGDSSSASSSTSARLRPYSSPSRPGASTPQPSAAATNTPPRSTSKTAASAAKAPLAASVSLSALLGSESDASSLVSSLKRQVMTNAAKIDTVVAEIGALTAMTAEAREYKDLYASSITALKNKVEKLEKQQQQATSAGASVSVSDHNKAFNALDGRIGAALEAYEELSKASQQQVEASSRAEGRLVRLEQAFEDDQDSQLKHRSEVQGRLRQIERDFVGLQLQVETVAARAATTATTSPGKPASEASPYTAAAPVPSPAAAPAVPSSSSSSALVAAQPAPIKGRWVWKSRQLDSEDGLTVLWDVEAVNSSQAALLWGGKDIGALAASVTVPREVAGLASSLRRSDILAVKGGLYQLSLAFFSPVVPPIVTVLVNSRPVLSSTGATAVAPELKDRLAAAIGEHDGGNGAAEDRDPHSAVTAGAVVLHRHHPSGSVGGVSLVQFLALPPKAIVSVLYDDGGESLSSSNSSSGGLLSLSGLARGTGAAGDGSTNTSLMGGSSSSPEALRGQGFIELIKL